MSGIIDVEIWKQVNQLRIAVDKVLKTPVLKADGTLSSRFNNAMNKLEEEAAELDDMWNQK